MKLSKAQQRALEIAANRFDRDDVFITSLEIAGNLGKSPEKVKNWQG